METYNSESTLFTQLLILIQESDLQKWVKMHRMGVQEKLKQSENYLCSSQYCVDLKTKKNINPTPHYIPTFKTCLRNWYQVQEKLKESENYLCSSQYCVDLKTL